MAYSDPDGSQKIAMVRTGKLLCVCFLGAIFYLWTVVSAYTEPIWKFSASATYETGKYGTDTQTDTLYVPVTIKRYLGGGDFSLTVPYLSLKSGGLVTVVDGLVFKIKKSGATPTTTNSGLGDIILKGSLYIFQEQQNQLLDLSLAGKIKVPTADDQKGLGTGEYDETVGIEISKRIFHGWTTFIDAYYTFIGSPPGTDLNNRTSYDVGLANQITPSLTDSIFYEESTSLINGIADIRDVLVGIEYKITQSARFFGGGEVGLSDSSPDYGITAGVSVKF